MCGKYVLAESPSRLAKWFEVQKPPDLPFDGQRFNIAPSQQVPIIRLGKDNREMVLAKWGLIPSWAKDAKIGYKLINARGETVASKPSFRSAFKSRRCLIPANGFYEWKKLDKSKQPYFMHMKDKEPFAFAGLWEHWQPAEGEAVDSCTIITTEANEFMKTLHERMPVILAPDDYSKWLAADQTPDKLLKLICPFPGEDMTAYPVSTMVNNPKNQEASLIQSIA
jgi:putative SOS response-associated peptidase YedK